MKFHIALLCVVVALALLFIPDTFMCWNSGQNKSAPASANSERSDNAARVSDVNWELAAALHSMQELKEKLAETEKQETEIATYRSLLLALIGFIALYFYMDDRKRTRQKKKLDRYSDDPTESVSDSQVAATASFTPAPESSLPKTMVSDSADTTVADSPKPIAVMAEKYFQGEVMVTAGPRKNFDQSAAEGDYGLGEDVAGLIIKGDNAFFWVLDGTSDSDHVTKPILTSDKRQEEIFSSRLLAQTIGWKLHSIISGLHSCTDAQAILQNAITQAEGEWRERFNRLNDEQDIYLKKALETKNGTLQCSSTAVFGILTLSGELDVCQIGDSEIIAYPDFKVLPRLKGRLFASLQKRENTVELSFNEFQDAHPQVTHERGIRTALVMSDGISNHMKTWLRSRQPDFTSESTRQIVAQFNQKTFDDKALCIIHIKGQDIPSE